MLRITVRTQPELTTLKVEGRLVSAWVDELNKSARKLLLMIGKDRIALDLTAVTHVDPTGRSLLAELARQDIGFISDDPVMNALVEEIGARRLPQSRLRPLSNATGALKEMGGSNGRHHEEANSLPQQAATRGDTRNPLASPDGRSCA